MKNFRNGSLSLSLSQIRLMETKSMSKAVRVVARVKPSSSDPAVEASSASSVSVHKRDQSETVSVSFGAQFAG